MQEFTERASQIDTMESAYKELSRSHDYTNDTLFTTEELEEKASYWLGELQNPLRSERNLQEVKQLVELLLFEVTLRKRELNALETHYTMPAEKAV